MAELPDKARTLFEAPNLLFVATVNQDGCKDAIVSLSITGSGTPS